MFFQKKKKNIYFLGAVLSFFAFFSYAFAGAPSGADTFQLLTSVATGGDNTGDGGTGNVADYNYYYVGQSFITTIQIVSGGTTASNIWIDYDSVSTTASNITNGTYFNTWSGQTINTTARGTGLGRAYITGSNIPVVQSSGTGNFGTVTWTLNRPTAANYGTGGSKVLDINVGSIGNTTESNISLSGVDLLDDAEDFHYHVWADTKKPFAGNPSPSDASNSVSIDSNYVFDLRDTLNGEGDNTGVGTGVDTSEPPGAITFNDGGGAVDYTSVDSFSCSGLWGTNLCTVTVNPGSPLSIAGDTRNWKYNTTYTVQIGGFQDLASESQDQLGDTNGPNVMNQKTYTFTTEADSVAPRVTAETPVRSSTGVATTTNIVLTLQDRKTYANGPSGTGIDASTCRINISSSSFSLTTYQQGDAGVTVGAVDYGYQFTINPATNFGQNETVAVSVYDCEDLAGNTLTTDNYNFSTADTAPPVVDTLNPADDAEIATDGTIGFHIKDTGVGVDLDEVVIYVDGVYYTTAGGSGTVTSDGTVISYSSSLDFDGGNYVGDTTSRSGSSDDYTFVIDPEDDFNANATIPIIIYAKDLSGNIMSHYVYAISAEAVACAAGSTYCGANTEFSGGLCVGTGGGSCVSGATYCGDNTQFNGSKCVSNFSCGDSGGSAAYTVVREISNVTVSQVDETSVLLTWSTNGPGSSRVVYDTQSHDGSSTQNYDYKFFTKEKDESKYTHSVVVEGLVPGQLYYFRPESRVWGAGVFGDEVQMTPFFATKIVEKEVYVEKEKTSTDENIPPVADTQCEPQVEERIVYRQVPVFSCPSSEISDVPVEIPTSPSQKKPTQPDSAIQATQETKRLSVQLVKDNAFQPLSYTEVSKDEVAVEIRGKAAPNTELTIIVY